MQNLSYYIEVIRINHEQSFVTNYAHSIGWIESVKFLISHWTFPRLCELSLTADTFDGMNKPIEKYPIQNISLSYRTLTIQKRSFYHQNQKLLFHCISKVRIWILWWFGNYRRFITSFLLTVYVGFRILKKIHCYKYWESSDLPLVSRSANPVVSWNVQFNLIAKIFTLRTYRMSLCKHKVRSMAIESINWDFINKVPKWRSGYLNIYCVMAILNFYILSLAFCQTKFRRKKITFSCSRYCPE